MLFVGILSGLLAAVSHAAAFALSRRFVVHRQGTAMQLMVISHTLMMPASLILLALIWDDQLRIVSVWLPDVLGATTTYLVGQATLLWVLRHSPSSRIVPLLGLKVAATAPASLLLLPGFQLHWPQYLAVALSVVAAMLLNRIGGRLPLVAFAATIMTVILLGFSDVFIFRLVQHLGSADSFVASARAVCLCYGLAGAVAALSVPWLGSWRPADWRAAVPFSAIWLPSMFPLFVSIAICGPVLGNIVLGTRGLFAIALGVVLVSRGMVHLEPHASGGVILRRTAAAVLMILAIAVYSYRPA